MLTPKLPVVTINQPAFAAGRQQIGAPATV
jgi:hypothetical protein